MKIIHICIVLILMLAFDQNCHKAAQPSPARPVWVAPSTSLCLSLAIAFFSSAFNYKSLEFFIPNTRSAFCCMYARLRDFNGISRIFHPNRSTLEKQWGQVHLFPDVAVYHVNRSVVKVKTFII